MKILSPLIFAAIAALGNAMFAAGQRKAVEYDNAFTFIALTAVTCVFFTLIFAPLFGPPNYTAVARENGLWIIVSGFGLFLTYLGFNLLYANYGTSHYILYAVLSIISTSIIVGVFLFKEVFNMYHWLAFIMSIITIILFTLGNKLGQA